MTGPRPAGDGPRPAGDGQGPNEPKRRPVLRAALSPPAEGIDPAARLAAAETTAAEVLRRGHADDAGQAEVETLVRLADEVGLDELAEVWGWAEPGSLPAALWACYALRAWCRTRPEEVEALVRAGAPHAEVAASIVGLPVVPGREDLRALGDELVRGVVSRDVPTGLHRAAAFARVLAAGRGASGPEDTDQGRLGHRLLSTADALEYAARRASGRPG